MNISTSGMGIVVIMVSLLVTTILASPEPANLDNLRTSVLSCGMQDPDIPVILSERDDQQELEMFDRIVGGTEAKPAQYPWMVSIARRPGYVANGVSLNPKRNMTVVNGNMNMTMINGTHMSRYYRHICGGSLITKDWVMTAAHCIYSTGNRPVNDYEIRLGTHKLYDTFQHSLHPSNVIIHPKYDPDEYGYDIGLIKLSSPITKFTTDINSVCLVASAEKPPLYTDCTVTGWGLMDENTSGLSNVLRQVDIKILPDSTCSYMLPGMICAGVIEGGKDACMGDSGGPLVYAVNTNGIVRYFQAGIVSFGEGCARPNSPGVYADVGYYLDWIKEVIRSNR